MLPLDYKLQDLLKLFVFDAISVHVTKTVLVLFLTFSSAND